VAEEKRQGSDPDIAEIELADVFSLRARVAELADAEDSKSSGLRALGVQVPPWAPNQSHLTFPPSSNVGFGPGNSPRKNASPANGTLLNLPFRPVDPYVSKATIVSSGYMTNVECSWKTSMPGAGAKRLHLGCFDAPAEGWVNTDITPHIWISRVPLAARTLHLLGKISSRRFAQHRSGVFQKLTYLNVADDFPFRANSIHAIFSCHLLEHLYPRVAIHCLQECHRVLCAGGVLRVTIPDLDKLVAGYDSLSPDQFLESVFQYGSGPGDKNSRHWHYNFNSLKSLLLNVGFSRAERRDFRVGDCPDVEKMDARPESLFVEAYK
jgi:hypothetical protein